MSTAARAFVSYARADGTALATVVQSALEDAGFRVWRDLRDLDALSDFSVEIERAIVAADVVIACITASIEGHRESFVRREILYAQSKSKPIVPLRATDAAIPVIITHLTWIDVADTACLAGVLAPEIYRRLSLHERTRGPEVRPSSAVVFARGLLDDIVSILAGTTDLLLDIAAMGWSGSQSLRGGLPSTMQRLVRRHSKSRLAPGFIGQELSESHKRIVLHGEAGSGKTTALLVAAREAANAWLEDQSRRLPVFCRAADWLATKDEPLLEWLDRSSPLLQRSDLDKALQSGRITLFIDGLDELGAQIRLGEEPKSKLVDPRSELMRKLPPHASVLATARSDAFDALKDLVGFDFVEMESISDEQIALYVAQVPNLAELLASDPGIRGLVQTPLTLGLLSFVANQRNAAMDRPDETENLSPRLRVIYDYTISRWQHESLRAGGVIDIGALIAALGRLATCGRTISDEDLRGAAEPEGVDGSELASTASQLGLIRRSDERSYGFFHPLFADCYATIHCWRFLGHQSPEGWDEQLFSRIAQLGDPAFAESLMSMATGFWRGEFGDEVATALAAVGDRADPRVVQTLVTLASAGLRLGRGGWIHRFVEGADDDEVRRQFVESLKELASTDIEAIHQLVGLGPTGIDALVDVYHRMDPADPMRGQIASYVAVRDRLCSRPT